MLDEVEAFVARLSPEPRAIAQSLRRLLQAQLPATLEMLDTPAELFGYGRDRSYRRLICTVAPHSRHVSLIFSRGTELADPLCLLEGTGKQARHVKFRTVEDVERPAVTELIRQAGALTP